MSSLLTITLKSIIQNQIPFKILQLYVKIKFMIYILFFVYVH